MVAVCAIMSNSSKELITTLFALLGFVMLSVGMVTAWGWSGALIVTGVMFFLIFLSMII